MGTYDFKNSEWGGGGAPGRGPHASAGGHVPAMHF